MSLEFNKAAAAVLTAGITFMVSGVVAGFLVAPPKLHEAAIATPASAAAPAAAAPAPAAVEPIAPLLAAANADNGRALAGRLCGACHNFAQGGPNGVGPNLYGVVGGPHAHAQGFSYSAAMSAKRGETWDYDALNAFLAKPSAAIPGTKMGFAGINNTGQRADVVAYLRSLSPSPQPLP